MILQNYPDYRKRLIELYTIITKRQYLMVLPRELLLDDEQIEGRYQINRNGLAKDNHFFTRPVDISLTIEALISIIPRARTPDALGLRNPERDGIEIYEIVQEYVRLWTEMIKGFPYYQSPSIRELYSLEVVSSWAFPIFSYYKKRKFIRQNDIDPNNGGAETIDSLLNVILNNNFLSKEDSAENSFISYTDMLLDDKPSLKVDYDQWIFSGGDTQC